MGFFLNSASTSNHFSTSSRNGTGQHRYYASDPVPENDVQTENEGPKREEYIVAQHVAILDEHEMTDASGEQKWCGPNELQEIANNNNRRVEQTGDCTPLVIGHTEDGLPEKKQPEIVGFATNFSVGPLFNTGKTALFADFHVKKNKVNEVNQYPRRSVELWPKRMEVDPISLLGATTPERDLGLLQLMRERNGVVRYRRFTREQYHDCETVTRYARSKSVVDTDGNEHRYVHITDDRDVLRYAYGEPPSIEMKELVASKSPRSVVGHVTAAARKAHDSWHRQAKIPFGTVLDGKKQQELLRHVHQAITDAIEKYTPERKARQYDRWPESRRDSMSESSGSRNFAGPHESFPIETQKDVDSAAKLIGHARNPEAVKRKIIAIARRRGLSIPASWHGSEATWHTNQYARDTEQDTDDQYDGDDDQTQLDRHYDYDQALNGDMEMASQEQHGDGSGGGQMEQIVQSVANSAWGKRVEQMEETLQEIMSMLQQGGGGSQQDMGGGQGGPDEQSREWQEGPPQRFAEYDEQDDNDDSDEVNEPMRHERCPPEQMGRGTHEHHEDYNAGYSSGTSFIPSEHEQYAYMGPRRGHMSGHHGGRHGPQLRRSRYNTEMDAYEAYLQRQQEDYLESLRESDARIRYERDQKEKQVLKKQVNDLMLERVKYARTEHLRQLQQSEGIVMDLADEVERTAAMTDPQFTKEVERIKRCYSRDPSSIQPFRIAPATSIVEVSPTARMSHDEKIRYSRRISDRMIEMKRGQPSLSDKELYAQAAQQIAQEGVRRTA